MTRRRAAVLGIRPSLVGYDNTTVKRALETLRHGSPEDYRKVCTHVATMDPRIRAGAGVSRDGMDPALLRACEAPGSYVKGSRVIVLRRPPDGGGGPALVRERADALRRLAGYSLAFWLERGR